MALSFNFSSARDPALALRIANCITGDIERMERTVFGRTAPTDWKRLPTPFKANYAVKLVNEATTQQHDELLRVLPSYEQNATNYAKDRNRRGRPLTRYEHDGNMDNGDLNVPNTPRGNPRIEMENKLPDDLPRVRDANPQDAEQELDDAILEILTDPTQSINSVDEAMERIRAGTKQRQQERTQQNGEAEQNQQGEGEAQDGQPQDGQGDQQPNDTNSDAEQGEGEGQSEQQQPQEFPPLDEDRVREIAREEDAGVLQLMDGALTHMQQQLEAIRRSQTVVVERKGANGETTQLDLGIQHKQFPTLLKLCGLRNRDGYQYPVWLPGPAGSGKTTAARNVAQALELPFQFTGAVDNPYQLLGFRDAAGHYHRTSFREAFEHGGIFLWDEVDASNPNALTVFNAALENGVCAFPDDVVSRHVDCIIIAAANTYGHGATHEYVGRNKLDAATVDRFIMLDWFYDEELERVLSSNKEWCTYVQAARKAMAAAGVKHVVSPRASIRGSEMLADGFDKEFCIKSLVRKGLPDDSWQTISSRMPSVPGTKTAGNKAPAMPTYDPNPRRSRARM